MTAYRIRAYMGGSSIDQVVEADNAKQAILKVSEQVDQGNVELSMMVSPGTKGFT